MYEYYVYMYIYGGYVNDGLWKKRRDPGEKCVRVFLLTRGVFY